MARIHPRICANCKHWSIHYVDFSEFPEDECGSCKVKNGETMYGDDEACNRFSATARPRVRDEDYWM